MDQLLTRCGGIFDLMQCCRQQKKYDRWLEVKELQVLFSRSIFSMIDIYNNLPQSVVDAPSVSSFQNRLTEIAKKRCKNQDPMWQLSFCRRGPDLDGSVLSDSSIM